MASRLSIWQVVLVNKSGRPVLMDGEHNLYIKDGVGIYQGKLKIKNYQDGRVYLTNKRVIYMDGKNAIGLNLADFGRVESMEKFLRRSPKVKMFVKQEADPVTRSSLEPPPAAAADVFDWVCVICSFNNHVTSAAAAAAETPRCVLCGIPASREQLERARAALAAADVLAPDLSVLGKCPRCTFVNHPLMRRCELCGTELRPASTPAPPLTLPPDANPLGLELEDSELYTGPTPYVKFSFRKGGEAPFYEKLAAEIDRAKWELLERRGLVSDAATVVSRPAAVPAPAKVRSLGIHALEQQGDRQRQANSAIMGSGLADMAMLVRRARDLEHVTRLFAPLLAPGAGAAAPTVPPLTISRALRLFHQEMARHVLEFLLNGDLTVPTAMVSMQDLFAAYNRHQVAAQGYGAELVLPADVLRAVLLLDELGLPVKTKRYALGLVVCTPVLHTDQSLQAAILRWFVATDAQRRYDRCVESLTGGRIASHAGLTAAEVAAHFGWSLLVCMQELADCMVAGILVADNHVSGEFYFANIWDPAIAAQIEADSAIEARARADVAAQQTHITADLRNLASEKLISLHEFGGISPQTMGRTRPDGASQTIDALSGLHFG